MKRKGRGRRRRRRRWLWIGRRRLQLNMMFQLYYIVVEMSDFLSEEQQTRRDELTVHVSNPIVDRQWFIDCYKTLGYHFNYNPLPALSIFQAYAADVSKYDGSTHELGLIRRENCVHFLEFIESASPKGVRSEKEKEKEKKEKEEEKKKKEEEEEGEEEEEVK